MKYSRPACLLMLLAPALLPGCASESLSHVPGPQNVTITRTLPARGWEVRDDGRFAGSVLLYADPAGGGASYYSVRNAQGQVLGLVDFDGRAWRYRLHEEQPEWIGTGTVLEGVRRILGTSGLSELEETEVAALTQER